MNKYQTILIVLSLMFHLGVSAHENSSNKEEGSNAVLDDVQAVQYVLKKQFDKPNAPLKVMPVSVIENYAVTGCTQGNKGGRALLKKEHGKWSIQVCSGDGLTKASTLEMTGMNRNAAINLAKAVVAAEKDLPRATLNLFASFEGIVKVNSATQEGQTTSHNH